MNSNPNIPAGAATSPDPITPRKLGTLKINRTVSRQAPASERLSNPPEGIAAKSWSLKSLTDTRENVIEAIQSAAMLPEEAKALLIAAINQAHPRSKIIRVDAHCQVMTGLDGRMKHHGCWDVSEV